MNEALELLRDGVWQSIGAFLTAITIILMLVFFYAQRQRKELAFGTFSRNPILTLEGSLAGKVKVIVEEQEVENVEFFTLGFKNSGNIPVQLNDYERPLTINFGNTAKVLSVTITRESPKDLSTNIEANGNLISVNPALLNPEDYILFNVLVSNAEKHISTNIRVIGISKLAPIEHRGHSRRDAWMNYLSNILIFTFIIIGTALFEKYSEQKPSQDLLEMVKLMLLLPMTITLLFAFDYARKSLSNEWNRFIPPP